MDKTFSEAVNDAVRAQKFRDREHELFIDKLKEKSRRDMELYSKWFHHLRRATAADFTEWLKAWVAAGGRIGKVYGYPLPDDFYVATGDFKMTPLYGARSISVIVPQKIKVTFDNIGHNAIYFMKGPNYIGLSGVSIYSDTREE